MQERFLDSVLRIFVRSDNGAGHGVSSALMLTNQRSESPGVSLLGCDHQRAFLRTGRGARARGVAWNECECD